ncbi:MAG TPA: hypothetical protein DEH78_20560 [Solibacterales bacterium]|nr:hypothetical protein [Bryobacterales bacterium]
MSGAGLCASCGYAKTIASGRGPVYLLCRRALTDPRFEKYPRLPVISCSGYDRLPATAAAESSESK